MRSPRCIAAYIVTTSESLTYEATINLSQNILTDIAHTNTPLYMLHDVVHENRKCIVYRCRQSLLIAQSTNCICWCARKSHSEIHDFQRVYDGFSLFLVDIALYELYTYIAHIYIVIMGKYLVIRLSRGRRTTTAIATTLNIII